MRSVRDWLGEQAIWLSAPRFRNWLPHGFGQNNRRLIVQSALVGAAVWLPVYLLKLAVHETFATLVNWLSGAPTIFVAVPLLLGATIVAFIVTRGRTATITYVDRHNHLHELLDVEGDGLERTIALYYTSEPSFERAMLGKEGVAARWELPTLSLAGRKLAATWATLGSGGSGGLEGSVALIGESIAAALFKPRSHLRMNGGSRWLRWPISWWSTEETDHLQTAQLSGIAAAIATMTGAPFMSAFFAAEVMYRRRPLVEKLIYSLVSTLVAYFLNTLAQAGHRTLFEVESLFLPPDDWGYYGLVILIAIVISLTSILFIGLRRAAETQFQQRLRNPWVRHLAGAGLTSLVAMMVMTITINQGLLDHRGALNLILSTGDWTIEQAMAGELTLWVALIALGGKMLATAATIGSGGSAGLLIPSLYLGAMVASIFGALTPYEPMTLIVPAMTASLVSIVNVPLAAMLLPVEMFSAHYLPPALVAVVVCALLTQDTPIYRSQREAFDNRQIAPGVAVRRILVPAHWDRRTLVDLDLRRRFDVTIIGVLELVDESGQARVRLDPSASICLRVGDTVVALGTEEDLDRLEQHIQTRLLAQEPFGQSSGG